MRIIQVSKAETLATTVEDGRIDIVNQIPPFTGKGWELSAARFYEGEAAKIYAVLIACLPQATRHALVRAMLAADPCLYRGA